MKKIGWLIWAALCLCACRAEPDETRTCTVVTGHVVNRTDASPGVITVIECDPLGDGDRHATRLDASGYFEARMPFLWGHSFTIAYGGKFINVYAGRGDSVHLEVDACNLLENKSGSVVFSGDNAAVNGEFCDAFFRLNGLVNEIKLAEDTVPLKQYMRVYESEYCRLLDSVRVYADKHPMGEQSRFLMEKMILFSMANYCMGYAGTGFQDVSGFFTHPLFALSEDRNFKVMMFPYHAAAYMQRLIQADSAAMGYARAEDMVRLTKRGVELLSALPEGLYRDVMFYKFFSRMKESGSTVPPEKIYFGNGEVYRLAGNLFAANEHTALPLPELKTAGEVLYYAGPDEVKATPAGDFCQYLAGKYQGKIVYLDIWATWCGPCRGEMKPAKELHKLYKGQAVVFVNLCMNSSRKAWQELVASGEVEGENYYFSEDASAVAMSALQVGGFPTYLILNKKGEIISLNPPRPSAISQLSEVLDRMLKEE